MLNNLINKLFFAFATSLILIGCGNSEKQSSENQNSGQKAQLAGNVKDKAEFSFETTTHDLGKIKQGETVIRGFIFKNTGSVPLVIEKATASCGCTVPEYSKGPIQPGEEGYVDVEYNSDGKSAKQFEQTVTVMANTPSGSQKLTITGEVVSGGKSAASSSGKYERTIDLSKSPNRSQQQRPVRPQRSGGKDKFGRGPNHPHYQHNHPPQNRQGNAGAQQQNQGGKKDQYGRGPNHPHYQHNHPPQNNRQGTRSQPQQQSQGKKDQYGRGPNHPHYQHNHPPQNNQQGSGKQQGEIQLKDQNQDGGKDKYGRKPSHPHYQHNHPTQ